MNSAGYTVRTQETHKQNIIADRMMDNESTSARSSIIRQKDIHNRLTQHFLSGALSSVLPTTLCHRLPHKPLVRLVTRRQRQPIHVACAHVILNFEFLTRNHSS